MKKKKLLLRRDAIITGKSMYFTGKPCSHGHTSHRYTSTGHCLECLRLRAVNDRIAIKKGREQAVIHV
jgi:hypothetical protein